MSVHNLVEGLGVSPSTLSPLINGQSGISPGMALGLSKAIGRSPESWLATRHDYELWHAHKIQICLKLKNEV